MMGFDDMLISFGISYVAGNLPTIKDYLQRNKPLHDKIDSCYSKALKKWTVNDGIRRSEKLRQCQHMEELEMLIAGDFRNIDEGVKALLLLWADELRNDPVCYDFIMERKVDVINVKQDAGFAAIIGELTGRFDKVDTKLDSLSSDMQKIKDMMAEMYQNRKADDDDKITAMIERIIESTTETLIGSLHLKTALKQVEQIEAMFADVLENNPPQKAQLLFVKGKCLSLYDHSKACQLYHEAYNLAPTNERCIEAEVKYLIAERRDAEAKALSNQLDGAETLKAFLSVVQSENQKEAYRQLDENMRKNYQLRMMLIKRWGESKESYDLLFSDENIDVPEELNFQNLMDWIYVITYYNLQTGGFLQMSDQMPAMPEIVEAFYVGRVFNSLVQRTEITDAFIDAKALYCYWGYIAERNVKWIDEYQKIDKSQWTGAKRNTYYMKEASMLTMSGRYPEAFAIIASLKDDFDPNLTSFAILLSYHSGNISYFDWLMNLRKEKGFKIDDECVKHIALCIRKDNAAQIQKWMDADAFEKSNNAYVLTGLCQYYNGDEVDLNLIKGSLAGLSDDMTAYAAMLLSALGEPELAYQVLSPKVEDGKIDFKKRVFIDVMQKMPSEHPKLYKMLQDIRHSGEKCDDGMLLCEFNLDMRLADFENAHEVATLLYERAPQDEARFVNLMMTKGKVCPQDIKGWLEEIMKRSYSSFNVVKTLTTTLTENGYICESLELLYRHTVKTEDWGERTYYYQETTMGPLSSVARVEYETVGEGLYAVCDLGNGERKTYQAKDGNRIGKELLGMKEDEKKKVEIAGEEREITVLHILNKYGKLSYEIMNDSLGGDNNHLVPARMDMEHPLQSIEELMRRIDPEADTYQKRRLEALERYERGEVGLFNLVDDEDVLGSYYKMLFTQQKIYVGPWQFLLKFTDLIFGKRGRRYVLDMTSLLMLFEFENRTGCYYTEKFIVSKSLYEYIAWLHKNARRIHSLGYYDALNGGHIKRLEEYSDSDMVSRCKSLLAWMDDRCETMVADKSLAMEGKQEKGMAAELEIDALALIVEQSRVLISDDHYVELHFRGSGRVITTEAFSRKHFSMAAADSYWEFLMACNYIGLYLPKDFIVNEYMKMEKGIAGNKMTFIMQTAAKNYVIYADVVNASVGIMQHANNKGTATITITNLLTMMIKSFRGTTKAEMVELAMQLLDYPIWYFQRVRQCLSDAARINNLVI